jgi:hypothetical protein
VFEAYAPVLESTEQRALVRECNLVLNKGCGVAAVVREQSQHPSEQCTAVHWMVLVEKVDMLVAFAAAGEIVDGDVAALVKVVVAVAVVVVAAAAAGVVAVDTMA